MLTRYHPKLAIRTLSPASPGAVSHPLRTTGILTTAQTCIYYIGALFTDCNMPSERARAKTVLHVSRLVNNQTIYKYTYYNNIIYPLIIILSSYVRLSGFDRRTPRAFSSELIGMCSYVCTPKNNLITQLQYCSIPRFDRRTQ